MKKLFTILGLTAIFAMVGTAGTVETPSDGAQLFKKCTGCHGSKGERKALGKSKVISEMKKEDIKTALTGYKDGSYGGAMKGIMKGQVMSYSDKDIAAVADYIGKTPAK